MYEIVTTKFQLLFTKMKYSNHSIMKPQDIKENPQLEVPNIQTETFFPEKSFAKQHIQTFPAMSIARQHPIDLNKQKHVSEVEKHTETNGKK